MTADQYMTFADVAQKLPPSGSGRRFHERTIQGWVDRGYRTRDGRTVRLAAVSIGRRRYVTPAALRAFIRSLSTPPPSPACPGSAVSDAGVD